MTSSLVMRAGHSLGLPHTHLPRVTSTNDTLRELAESGAPEGACVTADFQTAGRGRFGRRWMSLEARNLLLSVLLRPQVVPNEVGVLSLLGAVAVAEAIEAVTPLTVTVKWPNDVLVRGKKCCGMLLESSLSGGDIPPDYVIMGIGLNVNQDRFDQLASPNATSLLLEIGRPVERQVVLDALMDRLSSRYRTLVATGADVVRNEYLKRLEGLGCELNFRQTQSGAVVPAVIEDVTTSGAVVVRLRDGTQMTLSAGEITTRETESHNTTDGVADDMRD